MRRAVLEDIGGYDPRFPHSADLLMWLRAAARSDIGRVNGTVQAYYRVHAANMHSTQFGGILDDYTAVRDTYDAFFVEDAVHLSAPETLRTTARTAIAREAARRTVLLSRSDGDIGAESLLRFAVESAGAERRRVMAYRRARSIGLSGALRAVENARWRIRHHRALRFGI